MSYDLPTGDEAIKSLRRELEILRESIPVNTFFIGQEQGHTGTGQLSDSGSIDTGITTYHPSHETLINTNQLQVTATTIIVDGSGNDLELQTLIGTQYNGQILTLKPKEGKTLTLKSGGNIDTSSDIEISDTEFTILQYFEDATATANEGNYLILNSSGGGSSGVALGDTPTWTGNHIFQEDVEIGTGTDDLLTIKSAIKGHTVNISDVGNTADTVFVDANLDMNTWNIYDLDSLYFSVGSSSTSPAHDTASYSIDATDSGSNESLNFYTKSGKDFKWFEGGSEKFRYDGADDELRMSVKIDMNTNRIENCGDPVNNNDVVNKQWFNANQSGGISASDDVTWTGDHIFRGGNNSPVKFQGDNTDSVQTVAELGSEGSHIVKIVGEIHGVSPWEDMQNPDGSGQNNYDIPSNGAGLNVDTSLILNTHNIYDIDQLVFARGTSSLTPTWEADHIGLEFTQDNSYNDTGLGYHVDTGLRHRFFVYNNEILTIDNNGITAGGDAGKIGIHVSESTGKGTKGQMEIPYAYGSSYPSNSDLDSWFGDESGSIGVFRNSNSSLNSGKDRFYFNGFDGWNYIDSDGLA